MCNGVVGLSFCLQPPSKSSLPMIFTFFFLIYLTRDTRVFKAIKSYFKDYNMKDIL